MKSLENIIAWISNLPITKDEKAQLLITVEPSFDFRAFLQDKYEVSADEVETMIQEVISKRSEELNSGTRHLTMEDYIDVAVRRSARFLREYAETEGYDRCDELESALQKLLRLGIESQMQHRANNN